MTIWRERQEKNLDRRLKCERRALANEWTRLMLLTLGLIAIFTVFFHVAFGMLLGTR